MQRIAEAIASNNHRNLFFEVNKIKGCGNILPACVDGASSDNNICGLFCKKNMIFIIVCHMWRMRWLKLKIKFNNNYVVI